MLARIRRSLRGIIYLPFLLLVLSCFLQLFITPLPAFAAGDFTIGEGFISAKPGRGMRILTDRSGALTIHALTSPAMSAMFVPSKEAVPNFGYTKSAVWVRIPVTNTLQRPADLFLEVSPQFTDHVDFYYPDGTGYGAALSGDEVPFTMRKVFDRNIVFPVTVPTGTTEYFLQLRTAGPLSIALTLWDRDRFHEAKTRENTLLWLFFGMIAALVLYNAFIFIITRDTGYLYYVLFMTSFLIWIMCYSGSAYQYLWPESPIMNFMAIKIALYLVAIFSIQFARKYLDTGAFLPRFDRLLTVLMAAAVLGIGFTAATRSPYADIIVVSAIAVTIIVLNVLAVTAYANRIRLALNYLVSWSPILVFGMINILRGFGAVPENRFTHYSTHIGSVLQGILFSLALTNRLNLYRDERIRALDELRVTEEKYRMLYDNTAEAVLVIQDMRIILSNSAGARLLGYGSDEDVAGRVRDHVHPDDYSESMGRFTSNLAANGKKANERFRIVRRDGAIRWVDGSAAQIQWEGKPAYLILLLDVTEEKEYEEKLKKTINEKDVLLKEIHHRVKNNLQVISSLLTLSQNQLDDDAVQAVFNDSRSRIRTMALIHERIYQSGDLMNIDFSKYISELASSLVQTGASGSGTVNLRIDSVDLFLDIDTAIPCGLIVNELVTNCLKHAFPSGRSGVITISLSEKATPEGPGYRLTVRDDGIGISGGIDIENQKTLGIQLVNNLTRQIRGTCTVERDSGTAVSIEFPAK